MAQANLSNHETLENPWPALDVATEAALRESIRGFGVIYPVIRDQHGQRSTVISEHGLPKRNS